MSELLEALRLAAAGARHTLFPDLVRLGLAVDNPIVLTDAGKARLRVLEDEHYAALQKEFPEPEEEEDGFFPEP